MTEPGIGSYRRDPVLGNALAGLYPYWHDLIPLSGVSIQPASCIFLVLNRKSTRIFGSASTLGGGNFSKNWWRHSALRFRSGRGEKRLKGQFRREACATLARCRTIGAAPRS